MATWNSPAVARRWLAYELRRLREDRGLAQKDVGKACGWSGVRVSYLEKWDHPQRIFDRDLNKLLPLYEVPEADRSAYYEAAEEAREKGWWERYGEDVVPSYVAAFIGLEQGASSILTFEPTIVPGLLQTGDYVEKVLEADMVPRTPRFVRQVVEVREARRDVLTRDEPAELVAVVDESALRRLVGGPRLMADQMQFVLELTERPNVHFHVFPFDRGVSRGMLAVSHRILHFPGSAPPLVYMETRDGAQWIEDEPGVDAHDLAIDELVASALDEDESKEVVTAARDAFEARA